MRRRGNTCLALPAAVILAVTAPSARSTCPLPALRSALETPRPGDLYLRAGRATCTSLEIDVVAHGVEGLFTVAFDLHYPAALLKFEGHAPGPLLRRGAPRTPPLFLVRGPAPGQIQVSMTRFAPDGAVAAAGSETLITLRFTRIAGGSDRIDFALDPGSPVAERIVDDEGRTVSARFGPGHGGSATIP